MAKKYLIIGGVAAGASAAARLRRLDESAEIIMFEKGPHVSFSNCGLPYHLGGYIEPAEKLILMTPEKFDKQYNIDARTNSEVVDIDKSNKLVTVLNHKTGDKYTESYDKLVVAVGAKPIVPPFEGLDSIDHFILRNVVDVEKIHSAVFSKEKTVKNVTVIGAGFIGIEVAENLKERGFNVTIVEMANQIMRPFDYEMVKPLEKELLDRDISLMLSEKVVGFESDKVLLESGKNIDSDLVVLSIGVAPDTAFLKNVGIDLAKSGHIVVNKNYQTSDEDIYAAGDAILVKNALTGQDFNLPLAGPANKQGRLIADHINGKKVVNKGYIASSIIQIFHYTGAATGLNEAWIKFYNLDIDYGVAYTAPFDRVSIMPNAEHVFTKILFEKSSGKLLGAQVVGKGIVDKRADVFATAIKAGMTIEDLQDLELCYAPPYSTGKDVVNHTGYVANNLHSGEFRQISFTKVAELVAKNAQVVDVREVAETRNGMLKNVKNIPMSEIRSRLSELDKTKPVYVHCHTGQRSYNVALMLQQHGFDVYNISGGYIMISYYYATLERITGEKAPFNKANFN
ncbi:FAD-dependent oxidoreductase [Francisella adeliensis]|uniref:Pyridine nucleotide-disulfide oxidoreductase n=1 Tax=Francisella adeliensis TaxID=2007306 RepID=A0A2Z4XX41_9GAMM|nr:FAD-dependent oxidoreductase [Francisella adeliensis]AXA33454.1 pyridine nucleotide-disulfide oxidoreductase [Francisella adeliensis]MBK2085475.1 FAD-dependent oxidoreductase [Francisella adeliensis]MBK2097205.1 FAD-dependent oxidoreductase [Francisella adeliensis]QIW11683.1 SidA/IucD/PvdA family monooxygenase [Francisella adeliensis]QIW13557.1 SidA/IucD/PvdA family monooxygenase [Francisella adeliensis]